MFLHALIHQWLRVTRLVCFVVSETTEPDDIEHHVLVILLPIIKRDAQRPIRRFGIVSVDVKNR